jgi:hypothetical protein
MPCIVAVEQLELVSPYLPDRLGGAHGRWVCDYAGANPPGDRTARQRAITITARVSMIMAAAYGHPPGTPLICPEALNDACSSPIARILPPKSTSWAPSRYRKTQTRTVGRRGNRRHLRTAQPRAVPGDHHTTKLDNPVTAAVLTEC